MANNEMSTQKTSRARRLLEKAIAEGLTVGEALNAFAAQQGPIQRAYVEYAKEALAREGDTEVDDNAIVSLSKDGDAYVMSWIWVGLSELPMPANPLDAFARGYESILFELDEGSSIIECNKLQMNDAVIEALRQGKSVSDEEWLVRPKDTSAGKPWPLTVKHLKALTPTEEMGYEGELDSGEAIYLQFTT